jgi:hypothetical protein
LRLKEEEKEEKEKEERNKVSPPPLCIYDKMAPGRISIICGRIGRIPQTLVSRWSLVLVGHPLKVILGTLFVWSLLCLGNLLLKVSLNP